MYREEERQTFPTLKHCGVSAIPRSSLGRGLLCRPWKNPNDSKRSETEKFMADYGNDPSLETIVNRARGVFGTATTDVVGQFVAAPIIGTTNLRNLKDIVDGCNHIPQGGSRKGIDIKLTEEEIKYFEEPYRPMTIVGH
ncbi:hypothetical protein LXA43DRAFT_1091164 [Ganoderma leucocontextum]|nr:hypothetical protein LXA43DRAFT_1091164 [Ganoderma leucocontextum]